MRKLLLFSALLVVSVVSAQDLWDGKTVVTQFYGGSGTVTNPYQIRTGAELMYFANLVNAGDDFSGKTVKLMNDIDMNRKCFNIIQTFAGTFDGGCHKLTMWLGYGNNSTGTPPFNEVTGRIHHLAYEVGLTNQYNGVYYGSISFVGTLKEDGVLEDFHYTLLPSAEIFSYAPALVYSNYGIIRNCYASGPVRIYGGYSRDGSQLTYDNYDSGVIENCYANMNGGKTSYGIVLPLSYSNRGIESHNTTMVSELNEWVDDHPGHSYWVDGKTFKLVDFNASSESTIEFIDTLFNTSLQPIEVATGLPVGSLPIPDADCTFIGWNRFGNLVKESDVVNANWTLFAKWEQRIRKQPSIGSMRVEVDDVAHASFQWYAIYGEAQQYGNWQSTNHSDESTQSDTLTVTAKSGQQLKFSYTVSSEQGSDVFSFFCNGNRMLSASGEESGEFIYDIPADGTYKLVFRYSKDVDTRSGKDMAMVENIRVVDLDHLLPSTSASVGASNLDKSGLYYCKISYSNTGVILTTDTINVFKVTDISQIENTIYIEPVEGLQSTTIDLDVKMKNVLTSVGCSFTLILPEGVRLEKDADGDIVYELDGRARKQWVTLLDLGNGKYDCTLAPSTAAATIMGNDGALIKLHAIVPDDMAVGDYMLQLKNCMLQSKDNGATTEHALIDVTTKLTVVDYVPGDVDGDGGLSSADVAMMTNHAIGKEQTGFNAKAADMNGDERVTIADIVIIIEKILKLEQAEE